MNFNFLTQKLEQRKSTNNLRALCTNSHLIDFASNDYLGFARSEKLKKIIQEKFASIFHTSNGSTGSRLISGNSLFAESLEQKIAQFHRAEAGLLFNSGYDANVGLLACLAQKGDTYLSDELIHASMIDGIRLSYAEKKRFKHNDLQDLEDKLRLAEGHRFVCVESVYSMDGDIAPLKEIIALTEKYDAHLIVDEAHATGVFGENGKGLVFELGLQDKILARVHTFGKALGTHGAIVLGSKDLKDYLVNFARSFIYTTALPLHSLISIDAAYQMLEMIDFDENQKKLYHLIQFFQKQFKSARLNILHSQSPIQGIIISGNEDAKQAQNILANMGMYSKAILSPTIPEGQERLRICLHTFNQEDEIKKMADILKESIVNK